MGSFAGHIDEAIFFLLIAFWWMVNSFTRYIKSTFGRGEYRTELSYSIQCCRRNVPIEAIFKTLFPICGFLAEVWSRGPAITDDKGHFRKLEETQHMSIYALFILHGIIDILTSMKFPFPAGLDYLSGALAFGWYGLSFSFHANMPGKEPLEAIVHVLPVAIIYLGAISIFLSFWLPSNFPLMLIRIFSILVLGSFFTQVSFVLFRHDVFPGWQHNPNWDQSDERNVHFIIAAFGFHLSMQLIVMMLTYVILYFLMKRKAKTTSWKPETATNMPLLNQTDNDNEEL